MAVVRRRKGQASRGTGRGTPQALWPKTGGSYEPALHSAGGVHQSTGGLRTIRVIFLIGDLQPLTMSALVQSEHRSHSQKCNAVNSLCMMRASAALRHVRFSSVKNGWCSQCGDPLRVKPTILCCNRGKSSELNSHLHFQNTTRFSSVKNETAPPKAAWYVTLARLITVCL
jgi:hypothetical protein